MFKQCKSNAFFAKVFDKLRKSSTYLSIFSLYLHQKTISNIKLLGNMAAQKDNESNQKSKRKKTGGRKAGTPNKVTKSVRESLRDAIVGYLNGSNEKGYSLEADLYAIEEPAGRLAMVAKFLPYAAPKLQSVSFNSDETRNLSVEETFMKLEDDFEKQETTINIKNLKIVNNG